MPRQGRNNRLSVSLFAAGEQRGFRPAPANNADVDTRRLFVWGDPSTYRPFGGVLRPFGGAGQPKPGPSHRCASDATLSGVMDDQPPGLLATSLAAYARLAELGETLEDEWTYVTKLAEIGRARLRAGLPADGAAVAPERAAAIDALVAEAGRITDPHRAIDWLSTFPAVAELVFGGGPAADPPRQRSDGA